MENSIIQSLIFSIFKKDRPWLNCSCRSSKKIERDRIAHSDLLKRSTVSESLSLTVSKSIPSIFKKDWRERFDLFHNQIDLLITKNDWFDQKTADQIPHPDQSNGWQGCEFDLLIFRYFNISILRSSIFDLRYFNLFDLYKRANVIESLSSIF